MATVYKLWDKDKQEYLSVRGNRKSTWGSWPTQAIINAEDDEKNIVIHQFELQKVAEFSTKRLEIRPI